MAKQMECAPAQVDQRKKYPWDQWENGKWWSVTQGQDFTCKILTFEKYLRARAAEQGRSIEIVQTKPGVVEFCFEKLKRR